MQIFCRKYFSPCFLLSTGGNVVYLETNENVRQMKNFLILLLSSLLLFGCGHNINTADKQRIADSLLADSIAKVDSINLVHEQELAQIAYGGAMFGMSIEEVAKIPFFMPQNDWFVSTKTISKTFDTIGRFTYVVQLRFNDTNQLYEVDYYTGMVTADQIATYVMDRVDNFKNIIVQKYGEPHSINNIPSLFDYKPGILMWIYEWEIGSKRIEIGIKESIQGAEYGMEAQIYDFDLMLKTMIEYEKKHPNRTNTDAQKF